MIAAVRRALAAVGATSPGRLRRDLALVLVLAAVAGALAAFSQVAARAGLDSIDAGAAEAVARAGRGADLLVRAQVGADQTAQGAEPRFPAADFVEESRGWHDLLPPVLRARTASPSTVIASVAHDAERPAGLPEVSAILAVVDARSAEGLRLVDGRAARDSAAGVEAVVPARAAERAGIRVGDALVLQPGSTLLGERPVTARVVGVVDPAAAATAALGTDLPGFTSTRTLLASGRAAGSAVTLFTTAGGADRASAAFQEALFGVLRLRAVPARFDAASVGSIESAVAAATAGSVSWSKQAAPVQVDSRFGVALAGFASAAASAAGQQRVAIAGALAVGLLALLLLAGALAAARRGVLAIERVRGLPPGAAALRAGLEAALVVVPAVVAGVVAAQLVRPGPLLPQAPAAVLLVGVLAPAVAEGRSGAVGAGRRILLVGDLVLVLLAVLVPWLLQDGATGPDDPLLVAAPVLIALATAVAARRLAAAAAVRARPLLLRARGATAALVLAGRAGGTGSAITAIAVATAVAVAGAVLLGDLDAGRTAGSWRQVGADVRVTGTLPAGAAARVRSGSGVTAVSAAHRERDVVLVVGDSSTSLRLLGVDSSWSALVAATPGSGTERASTLRVPARRADGVLPILVAPPLAGRVGDDGRLLIDGRSVPVRVAGVAGAWPADDLARAGALADAAGLAAATGRTDSRNLLLVDGPGAAAATRGLPGTTLRRAAVVVSAERRALPSGVAAAVTASSVAEALLALLCLLVGLRATAVGRRREAALLAVLGLPATVAGRLLVARTAPPVLLAVLLGALGGAVAGRVLAPALGSSALAGAPSGAAPVLPVVLLAAAAALVAVVAAALLDPGGRRAAASGITALSTEGDQT